MNKIILKLRKPNGDVISDTESIDHNIQQIQVEKIFTNSFTQIILFVYGLQLHGNLICQ